MKKRLSIFFVLLALIITLGLLINSIYASSHMDKELLKELYYENEDDAFFFSNITDSLINNRINLYAVNWLVKINEITNINFSNRFKTYVKKYLSSNINQDFIINSKKDMHDIFIILTTMKEFNGEINDKSYYVRLIDTAIKENKWTYTDGDSYDELVEKTQILNIALQIFDILGEIPEDLKSNVLQVSKSIIDNPDYYNVDINNIKRNLIDFEIIVMKSLMILDNYTNDNLIEVIQKKEVWVYKQVEILNEILSDDSLGDFDLIILNDCIINIDSVFKYIGLTIELKHKYADNFTTDLIKEVFLTDPQIAFKIIKICKILNHRINESYIDFIYHNLDYWLFETPPNSNLQELYYAICLANKYNVRYNIEKINHFIDKYENSTIIQDIYYRTLLKNKLSKQIKINELSIQAIAGYTHNFNSNCIEDNYYLLQLFHVLNLDSNYVHEVINELKQKDFNLLIKEAVTENDIFYITKIANLLNIPIDSIVLETELSKFEYLDGLYGIEHESDFSNIASTYRIIEMKLKYNIKIDEDKKIHIKKGLYNFKGTHGGYFYTKKESDNKNYTDLTFESFYYGVILDNLWEDN